MFDEREIFRDNNWILYEYLNKLNITHIHSEEYYVGINKEDRCYLCFKKAPENLLAIRAIGNLNV